MFFHRWKFWLRSFVLILAIMAGSLGTPPLRSAHAESWKIVQQDAATPTDTPTNTATYTATPASFTLALQPNGTAGLDSYIYSGSKNSNYGTAVDMGVGEANNASSRVARSLIKFDLSSIPANATITSATLSLWTNADLSSNNRVIRVYRLKVPFNETQVTWNVSATGTNWQTAGAAGANDRESSDIGSLTVLNNEGLNLEKQIVLVPGKLQEMINGSFTNRGFVIVADSESNDRFNYKTSDATNTLQRPKLTVQYTVSVLTPSSTSTPGNTPTGTASATATKTPTSTRTATATRTLTPTQPTSTGTWTPTAVNTATPVVSQPAVGPLRVSSINPRYFADPAGNIVFLTGSHTWCDFMDCDDTNPITATFNYTAYLDFLAAHNHNFFHLWRAENARGGEAGPNFWFDPLPYQRSMTCCAFDGGNKFDLTQFNPAYFDRMRQRIVEAGDRGIYVSVMLFDGWSVESKIGGHNPWAGHPYNSSNNINAVNGDSNGDNQGGETHTLSIPQITALQEEYVKKVIDTVNDLDNVLYEISNESPASSAAWQYHLIDLIKSYESTKAKQHPVGMTWEWPGGSNTDLYNSPADWISLGGDVDINTYVPSVADGSKVILDDTDHLCGICGTRQWVWKSFTRGENPVFMDVYDPATTGRGMYLAPIGNEADIRNNLGYVHTYADRIDLQNMIPQPALCSTGYCLASTASSPAEFLAFLPGGGTISLDLSATAGTLQVEWFNPSIGTTSTGGMVEGGASRQFTAPFGGDAVLYVYSNVPPATPMASSTPTPSVTSTASLTATPVPSSTPSATSQPTDTPYPTDTATSTVTVTFTATVIPPTDTPYPTDTATLMVAPTFTATVTQLTDTPYPIDTATSTATLTFTATAIPPTPTSTTLPTDTATASATPSRTPSVTSTATRTSTATGTPTSTLTNTPTRTPTVTKTATVAATSTRTFTPASTASGGFPLTQIRDDFNRTNGAVGSGWSGYPAAFKVTSNQLDVVSTGWNTSILWNGASFGTDQEAYVTFSQIDTTSNEQSLILKSQSNSNTTSGLIYIMYDGLGHTAQVWTYHPTQGWVQYGANIPVTFANGDQFGARARPDGTVEIYRNGTLLATRSITAWPFYANGGYIGLWLVNAPNALLDNFGGGTR